VSIESLNSNVATAFFSRFPDLTQTQKNSIPLILNGDDTLVISGTGSGKTEAVLAPLLSRYFDSCVGSNSPIIIYVAPTKALVNDIAKRINPVLEQIGLGASIRHGDINELKLKKKHSVLITTPESFEVLMATNKDALTEVQAIVIDEAHLLFNQQRGFQLSLLIKRLELQLEKKVQVVAASATVSSPESLWHFFRNVREFSVAKQQGHREIRYQIRIEYTIDKLVQLLTKLPQDVPLKLLIFGDTKRECDSIALEIREFQGHSLEVFSHHASLSPEMRLKVEQDFNSSRHAVCVATSTLELGIDIGDINLVILWGKPRNWQSFMQRIGRGNRRHDFVEVICVLPKGNSRNVSELIGYQSMLQQITNLQFPHQEAFELFGVVCQQICIHASIKGAGFVSLSEFCQYFQDIPFLKRELIRELLLELTDRGILVKDPNRMAFGPSEIIHDLRDRDLLWSNIPHSASTVPIVLAGNRIGDINSGNLFSLNTGSVFAFAAKRLRVVGINPSEILVAETSDSINSILKFGGKIQPLELSLVSAVRDYVRTESYKKMENVSPKSEARKLGESMGRHLQNVDIDTQIPYFRSGNSYIYITFGGLVLNSALSKAFGAASIYSNDFTISANSLLDFNSISPDLSSYDALVGELDLTFGAETEFQGFLSGKFRALENVSKWHSESYYRQCLIRLRSSSTLEIQPPENFIWA